MSVETVAGDVIGLLGDFLDELGGSEIQSLRLEILNRVIKWLGFGCL